MRAILLGLILALLATNAQSRTWRVNLAGTGDAPTLHAAMDSAAASDIVLVEPGEYLLESTLQVPRDVHLVGEAGAAHTLLYTESIHAGYNTINLTDAEMTGIHVRGATTVTLGTWDAIITSCIVETGDANVADSGVGVGEFSFCLLIGGSANHKARYLACIIMCNLSSGAIGSTFQLCDVFGGTVYPGIEISPLEGNFFLDPQFCGIPGSGNYYLQSTSPCLPANNPFISPGYVVGPLPQGCSTVSVEERTWGSIKAMYLKR